MKIKWIKNNISLFLMSLSFRKDTTNYILNMACKYMFLLTKAYRS